MIECAEGRFQPVLVQKVPMHDPLVALLHNKIGHKECDWPLEGAYDNAWVRAYNSWHQEFRQNKDAHYHLH